MYDVGLPADALHPNITVLPLIDTTVSPDGALGSVQGPTPPTTRIASFDGALTSPELPTARTRT
jgi:hypothetical protein